MEIVPHGEKGMEGALRVELLPSKKAGWEGEEGKVEEGRAPEGGEDFENGRTCSGLTIEGEGEEVVAVEVLC